MNPRELRIIALLLGSGWLAAAQVGKVPPALPAIVSDLGLDMVQGGWIASAITSVTAVFGILSGLLVAVLGGSISLFMGLGLLSLGSLAGAYADTGALVFASRLIEGLGFVFVVVTAPSLLARTLASDPLRRRRFLIIWGTYMPAGVAVMMGIAPVLLAQAGWRPLWLLNAALGFAVLLLGLSQHRQLANVTVASPFDRKALGASLRLPGPWFMGLCFGCYTAVWFMLVTWLPSFAVNEMGFSLYGAAWLTATAVLANIGGNLSAQLFTNAGVARWVVLAGVQVVIGSLGWAVFSSGLSPGLRSTAAVLACGLAGALPATVFAGIPYHARKPDQVAVGNGIIMQCSSLGSFAGPPAIAMVVAGLGGWNAGRWLIPAVALLGLCAAVALGNVERSIARRDSLAS